ncbi:MAG: deoxyguanosinetriphosphate triphosphohydrolase, partial [Actinomycetota bacterium]|nr:deoxyguanosinetriphosphate triphosphohydrolase [Actinomycetota bacterium]
VRAVRGFDVTRAGSGEHAAVKRLTSELVGRFVRAATDATLDAEGDRMLRRHDADLHVPDLVAAEVMVLKVLATRYVMSDVARLAMQARQRAMLTELATVLVGRAPGVLDPVRAEDWAAATGDGGRLRVVVDQIAVLTDQQAITWHRRLA